MNKIKVESAELARVMKTIGRCLDRRSMIPPNVQITHEDGKLTIRATNGTFLGEMSVDVPGGNGETFCVDGDMFGRIVNLYKGMIEIVTDDKNCAMKGTGRTRLPIINAKVLEPEKLKGSTVSVNKDDLRQAHRLVSYAISTDQARQTLTGINVEADGKRMCLTAMDIAMMAAEDIPCTGDKVSMIIPGAFMDMISGAIGTAPFNGALQLITNGKIIQAKAPGMILQCALLQGTFPDYRRVLPETYKTEAMVDAAKLREALKIGNAVNNSLKTVKVAVKDSEMIISNNSAFADYEARIPCETQGDGLEIAFSEHVLISTMDVLEADTVVWKMNTKTSPVLIQPKGADGIHICMPVRLQEVGNGKA